MGRYGEVKSVYLGKFKRRVHHTCHHNVIVYQQTGNRAILRRESTACLLHDAYTGTPPLALHTGPRATNTSPSTLHTHLRLRLTVTHKHTITIIIISVQHREPLPPPVYHHTALSPLPERACKRTSALQFAHKRSREVFD